MGYRVRVSCKKCGFDGQFNLGQGLRDFDKEIVLSYFSDSSKADVSNILSRGELTNFERVLGYCKSCKKISDFPRLTYFAGDVRTHLIDKCSCGGTPEVIIDSESFDGSKKTLKCPICGDTLEITDNGMFD